MLVLPQYNFYFYSSKGPSNETRQYMVRIAWGGKAFLKVGGGGGRAFLKLEIGGGQARFEVESSRGKSCCVTICCIHI